MSDDNPWGGREPLYRPVVTSLGWLLRLRFAVRVAGPRLPATGPVLASANHVHRLDAVVLASTAMQQGRRIRFLALAELWRVPVLGWVLATGRMIPVHRGRGPEPMVRDACRALQAGEAVLVYPEGHLPRDDQHMPAQAGAGLLALEAHRMGAPVVPIAVWGLGAARSRRMLRRRLGVVAGAPVDLSGWGTRVDEDAARGAGETILAAVRALLPEAERLARQRR